MIEPSFTVLDVTARPLAAVPTLDFAVRVAEPSGREVYMLALTVGITVAAKAWTQVSLIVPAFTGETTFGVAVECSYEAATFHGASGDAPLVFHFNGQVFYRGDGDALQVELVPWSCSVDFTFPVAVWQRMMADHYAGGAFVSLHTSTLDALREEARRRGTPSLDACVEELLRCSTG